VAALDWDDAEEVDLDAEFGALDGSGQSGEAAADDDDALVLGAHGYSVLG
jgi:hypothetical protein